MRLLREYVAREKDELREKGVRVRVLGELDRLSRSARSAVKDIEGTTHEGRTLNLQLAISYSSRRELILAARALAERVLSGDLLPDQISEEEFERELLTSGIPDPDLLIRTSGEFRISNFLLWQVAYAELYVTPVLWPDFDRAELYSAILEFQNRERRFGKVAT
jgi:undecaprenyl diphosphate synthase